MTRTAPTVPVVVLVVVVGSLVGGVSAAAAAENQPPVAYFVYGPEHPAPGEEIVFDAHESGDEDGEVTSYAWDFDGDGTTDATGVEVGFVYEEPGTYEVTLTVTDNDGATASKSRSVEVGGNTAPAAHILYEPEHPSVGEGVVFSARESHDEDGEIVAYRWDLDGDGSADEDGVKVDRRFETVGEHLVSLTVEDDDGATHSTEVVVTVGENHAPKPYIIYEPEHPSVGEGVVFSARESHDEDGEIVAYRWDLDGDGTPDAEGPKVDRRFEAAGKHLVSLSVEDDDGATATTKVQVAVGEPRDVEPVHLGLGSSEAVPDESTGVPIVIEGLPSGLQSVKLSVALTHDEVGHVTGVEPADGLAIERHETDGHGVSVTLTDPENHLAGEHRRVVLGEVHLAAEAAGRSVVEVEVHALRDDEGRTLAVKSFDGKLYVARDERHRQQVTVVIDGAPDGLRRFGLSVTGPEHVTIKRVEPRLLGGETVDVVEGGVGHASVTIRGVDFGDRVGPFDGEKTLVELEVVGGVEPGAFEVEVGALVGDDGEPLSHDLVSVQIQARAPFDGPVPGSLGRGPPNDLDGDGQFEDVNGDGRATISDAIALAFVAKDGLDDAQVESLDFDGDGRLSFVDAVSLLRETATGR